MKAKKSQEYGSAQLAAGVRRKITRIQKENGGPFDHAWIVLESLKNWVGDWDKRAAKRKGGLGRKGAAK